MTDIAKLRGMSDAELDQALVDAKRDLWQARFELATRQLKDYTAISGSRRTVARVLTVRAERELERKNA